MRKGFKTTEGACIYLSPKRLSYTGDDKGL